jgi:hypothetical protein
LTYLFINYKNHSHGVKINDLFFSLHQCFTQLILVYQCYYYNLEYLHTKHHQVYTKTFKIVNTIVIFFLIASYLKFSLLGWLSVLSILKFFYVIVKYFPQAYLQHKEKICFGFSFYSNLFNFLGILKKNKFNLK